MFIKNELIRKIICENPKLLCQHSELNQKDIALEVVKYNGLSLKSIPTQFKYDEEIVLEAIKQNGLSLQYVTRELRNNIEIVLKAVKQKGGALQYASIELRNNKEIVLEAVKKNGNALVHASCNLQNDRDVVLEACKQDANILSQISKEFKNDESMIIEIAKTHNSIFILHYIQNKIFTGKELNDMFPDLELEMLHEKHSTESNFTIVRQDSNLYYSYSTCKVLLPDDAIVHIKSLDTALSDKIIIKNNKY